MSPSSSSNVTSLHSRSQQYKRGAVDPFTLDEDEGYSIDSYYCRSTDGHGHSENIQTKFPPEVAGILSSLVQSGRVPEYSSVQNVVRDAVIHRLIKVTREIGDGELERKITIEMQLAKLAAHRREIENNEQLVKELEELLEEAASKQDWRALERIIVDGEATVDLLRTPYQEKANRQLSIYRSRLKNK